MRSSIIICTHNPRREHLQRCLDALRGQAVPKQQWELLVVDNISQVPLKERLDLSWHPYARVIREETLGLTRARLRGIHEAKGELLVFVDDDNVLDNDFLGTAFTVADDKRFLGAWSGQCRPEFEEHPPEWSRRYWGNLVIREFEADVWSNLPRLPESMPCGAGLCVRREVAQHYLVLHETGKRKFQFDRVGNSLLSGGDNDLAGCACEIGLGVGLIASLRLTHLIPRERLSVPYLVKLAEATHFSSTLLDAEYGIPHSQRGLIGVIADLVRIARLQQPHRRILRAAFRGRDRAERTLRLSNVSHG